MTTGMSIAGRMSVFIRLVESTPKMAMSEQRTAMVYGRRSASRTIHIGARGSWSAEGRPIDARERAWMQQEIQGRRFPKLAAHALGGRHAAPRLRHRGGVQRESAPPAARPPGPGLPGGTAPRSLPGRGHQALLSLP